MRENKYALRSSIGFQEVTWEFMPAGAPHMGGLWEAGVKSLKNYIQY